MPLLLALQIGLTVSASATSWLTVREPHYFFVFAAIPGGAMLLALIRRGRGLVQNSNHRTLIALAGAIGWGMASGLLVLWLRFVSGSLARLPGTTLFIGFLLVWVYYVLGTLIGLWSGSHARSGKATS